MELPRYTITLNAFEAGVLMGMLEGAEDRIKQPLSEVWRQLILLKRDLEKADGVVKTIRPDGLLEIVDDDGNRIIRPPYSFEIVRNEP